MFHGYFVHCKQYCNIFSVLSYRVSTVPPVVNSKGKKNVFAFYWNTFQVSSFKFYLSHTRLYRDCITSSEMRVGSAPWTVQILKKQHKGSKHKIR